MEFVLKLLLPFTRWDPAAWFAFHSRIELVPALLLAAVGVLLCVYGPGALLRLAMVLPAAVGGMIAGPQLAQLAQVKIKQPAFIGAAILTGLALIWPPAILFLVAGGAAALLGGELAGNSDYWVGFIPGFVLGGVLLIAAYRHIAAAIAGAVGSYLLVLGGLALAGYFRIGGLLGSSPTMLLTAVAVATLAVVAFHARYTPDPERKAKEKVEDTQRRLREREEKEQMKRYEKMQQESRKRAG